MKNERERRTLPSASAARTVLGDLMPYSLAAELAPRRPICDCSDDHRRPASALAPLARLLPNVLIDEALVIARKIFEPTSRATGLVSLARLNLSIRRRDISRRGRGRLMLSPRRAASVLRSSVSPSIARTCRAALAAQGDRLDDRRPAVAPRRSCVLRPRGQVRECETRSHRPRGDSR